MNWGKYFAGLCQIYMALVLLPVGVATGIYLFRIVLE